MSAPSPASTVLDPPATTPSPSEASPGPGTPTEPAGTTATGTGATGTTTTGTARPVVMRPTGGLSYHWGLQAWIDMVMSRKMIADRGLLTVSHTFLPMLRMASDDPAAVDRDYATIRARREPVRLWDSPRERWRKYYGNFVREMEWVLLGLRSHFPREQYEELVIGTLASLSRLDSQREIDALNRNVTKMRKVRAERAAQRAAGTEPTDPAEQSGWRALAAKLADPTRFSAFLVGEAEVTEMDIDEGTAVMEVPNCAWHTCPDPDSLPRPGVLPEEGCLLVCKGLFERVFDGVEGLEMRFDPHLPETSCTIRMRT